MWAGAYVWYTSGDSSAKIAVVEKWLIKSEFSMHSEAELIRVHHAGGTKGHVRP